MENRIISFCGEVSPENVLSAITQILYFDRESNEPIYLYINSNGGSIDHGLALYDIMRYVNSPIYTVCTGMAASMGSFLLSCGKKGHRAALKHSRILIHQPLITPNATNFLKESEIRKIAERISRNRDELERILADNCDQPIEKIHADCERNYTLSADEAKAYGLIDEVI